MFSGLHTFLSAIEKEDLAQLKEWRNNPEFRKNFREYREINNENQEIWYNEIVVNDKNTIMLSIKDIQSSRVIGCCGLCYINWMHRYADLSFYIGKDNLYVDDVYAPDAMQILLKYGFQELGLNKIWTEVYQFDCKKLEFLPKLGFKQDGCLRENCFYDGKWWDSIIFSLLAKEFEIF